MIMNALGLPDADGAYAPLVVIGTLQNPRATIAKAVRERIAGDFEAQHTEIWRDGDRWFGEQDAIWRVHADTSMFIGAIRALLLQALHPVAMQAVAEHAGFRADFWGRFQRTTRYLALTTYGTVPDAERAIAAVRAVHRRVTGTAPDGRPYSADDPHLLMWVHVAEVDSFLSSFRAFGAETLTAAEADDYVRQTGIHRRPARCDRPTEHCHGADRNHGELQARTQRVRDRPRGRAICSSSTHRLPACPEPAITCWLLARSRPSRPGHVWSCCCRRCR